MRSEGIPADTTDDGKLQEQQTAKMDKVEQACKGIASQFSSLEGRLAGLSRAEMRPTRGGR